MIPQSEWVWYGFAGHCIVGSRCRFHLSTRIGHYLVSTIGDYRPDGKTREELGADPGSFFETMVFECDGETPKGDPNVLSWGEIDTARYAESLDAERNHRALCLKYAEMQ